MMLWLRLAALAALLPHVAQASDYTLRVGDLLRIEVIEDSSLNRNALVLPDGTIAFPMVGQLKAAGLSLDRLRKDLTAQLAPNFVAPPNLHVAVSSLAKQNRRPAATASRAARVETPENKVLEVFGMGELGKPGKLRITDGATLMQFVAQAGGLTPYAASKRIQVRRTDAASGTAKLYRINLKQMMAGKGQTVFPLQNGDVVIVPERRLFE